MADGGLHAGAWRIVRLLPRESRCYSGDVTEDVVSRVHTLLFEHYKALWIHISLYNSHKNKWHAHFQKISNRRRPSN